MSDIVFLDQNQNVPEGYSFYTIGDQYKVAFSKTADRLPIVRFRITEEQVCADKRQYSASKNRNLYKLLDTSSYNSCSNKVGGTKTDPRYTYSGFVVEKQLYQDNGVMDVINRLPLYPTEDSSVYNWNVFQNSYYSWSLECELNGGYTRAHMAELMDDAIDVGSKQLSLMVI